MLRVRVIEDQKNSTFSVGRDFGPPNPTESDLASGLLDLSSEWTSICMANVGVSSHLAFVGDALLERYLKDKLLPYLSEVAIGREEVFNEQEKKTAFSFIIDEQDASIILDRLKTIDGLDHAAVSKAQAHLGVIISDLEFFLLRIATEFSKVTPNNFMEMDEKITIGELFSAGNIDSIIASKIDKKIRGEMRGSHYEIVKWLYGALNLDGFSSVEKSQPFKDFLECCQRRHLFTHNGGVVNQAYIDKCKGYGLAPSDLPKIEDKLSVTKRYLRRSSGRAYLLGLFILHMAIQKLGNAERKASLQELLGISHDLLRAGNTKLAERVIDFAEATKGHIDNELKLSFGINRALAKLHDPNLSREQQSAAAAEILEKYDWSIVTPIFTLALACVKREFENLFDLAKSANQSGLSHSMARTFFVFKEARKIDGFMDCFPRQPLAISSGISDE